jgi:hypothetical protein
MARTETPDLFDLGYVLGARGWDADRGFFLNRINDYVHFATKAEAIKAARSIGWAASTVERCHTRFLTRVYALHHPHGGLLTPDGMTALRAEREQEHRTRTFERNHVTRPYNVNSRGMTGYRQDFETVWVCSCGNGGFGDDRDRASAQRAAKRHREDPSGFPGSPWANQATVVAVQAS